MDDPLSDRLRTMADTETRSAPSIGELRSRSASLTRSSGVRPALGTKTRALVYCCFVLGFGLLAAAVVSAGGRGEPEVQVQATPVDEFHGGECEGPKAPTSVAPEYQQQVFERAERERASGWTRITAQDMVTRKWYCGWTPELDMTSLDAAKANYRKARAIHSSLGGEVFGYFVEAAGFVSRSEFEAPGFDETRKRIEINGCDPFAEPTCEVKQPG